MDNKFVLHQTDEIYEDELDIEIREIIYHKLGESKDYGSDLFITKGVYETVLTDAKEPYDAPCGSIVLNEPKNIKIKRFVLDMPTTKLILRGDSKYRKGFEDFICKVRLPSYKVENVDYGGLPFVRITFIEKY